MFIDLNKMDAEGLELDGPIGVPDLEGPAGESIPVSAGVLRGRIRKGKHGFDLNADLSARAMLACSRCLASFDSPLATSFHLRLVPTTEAEPKGPPVGTDDEADVQICPEGKFDLVEAVAEQIYLNLPLKPVCREGCLGLCPVCGTDRNERNCGCPSTEPDLRWAPLLERKDRPKD